MVLKIRRAWSIPTPERDDTPARRRLNTELDKWRKLGQGAQQPGVRTEPEPPAPRQEIIRPERRPGPLGEIAEGFAPQGAVGLQEAAIRRPRNVEAGLTDIGARRARDFGEAVQGLSPNDQAKIKVLNAELRKRGLTPQDLVQLARQNPPTLGPVDRPSEAAPRERLLSRAAAGGKLSDEQERLFTARLPEAERGRFVLSQIRQAVSQDPDVQATRPEPGAQFPEGSFPRQVLETGAQDPIEALFSPEFVRRQEQEGSRQQLLLRVVADIITWGGSEVALQLEEGDIEGAIQMAVLVGAPVAAIHGLSTALRSAKEIKAVQTLAKEAIEGRAASGAPLETVGIREGLAGERVAPSVVPQPPVNPQRLPQVSAEGTEAVVDRVAQEGAERLRQEAAAIREAALARPIRGTRAVVNQGERLALADQMERRADELVLAPERGIPTVAEGPAPRDIPEAPAPRVLEADEIIPGQPTGAAVLEREVAGAQPPPARDPNEVVARTRITTTERGAEPVTTTRETTRGGTTTEVPAQAVDDFEPVTATDLGKVDRPTTIGGAGDQFAAPLRPIEDVASEVVTGRDPIKQALARSGINPSLLDDSEVGKALTAYYRQRGSSEHLTTVALAGALDSKAQRFTGRSPFRIGNDAIAKLDDGTTAPWNDLFSSDKLRGNLNDVQRAYVDDYRRVVEEMEFLRTQAGLKPRATTGPQADEGWYYIPRQVEGIRGNELRRPSNPGLQRHYEEAVEGIEHGVRYESDPRAVLELHVRQAYREIIDKQLSDFLEPLSISPKDLLPANVIARMEAAVTARRTAEQQLRRLQAQRLRTGVGRTPGDVPAGTRAAEQQLVEARGPARAEVRGSIREAQSTLAAARKEFNAAKAQRARAMEIARKAELAPGNLFGRAEDQIPVAQWRNRFFPLEDADRLNENLGAFMRSPQNANWVGQGFEEVGNHIRFLSAIGDFAAPFIQGPPLLARNPVGWGRATLRHYQAFFDPAVQARFIREHMDTLQEMAAHNVPIGDVEFFKALKEGGGFSPGRLLEILPKGGKQARSIFQQAGKQTFGRFQASYDMFLTSSRVQLWEGMRPNWQGSLDDLAAHVRNMTGGLDSRALGVGPTQRGIESTWLAFSPRLLRSTVALTADLASTDASRRFAAWRTLSSLAAGVTGIYVASALALGKTEEQIRTGLNPLEGKRFLSHQINGDWVGIGGQVRAIMQLLTRSAADPESLISGDRFDNPLLSFISSRGAVGVSLVSGGIEAATGIDAEPFEEIDSLPDLFKHIGLSSLPFALQGVLEGEKPVTTLTALAGARTSPERPRERFNELYREKFGNEPPADISPRQLDPALAAEAGFSEETDFARGRSEITAEEEGKLADLATGVLQQGSPEAMEQFGIELGDFFRFRSGVTETLVRDLGLPEREASLVQDYYNLDPRDQRDQETFRPDWDFFGEQQERILSQLRREGPSGRQAATALERGSGIKFSDPNLQRVYDARIELRDGLDEYYDTDPKRRENFRQRNPEIDAKLFLLGRVSRVITRSGQRAVTALSERLLGTAVEATRGSSGSTGRRPRQPRAPR